MDLDKVRGCSFEDISNFFNVSQSAAGSKKLRKLFEKRAFIPALGALNGQQAVQQVKAGIEAIYVSGWQTAAAHNSALDVYPDQSIYPVDSVPRVVKEIHNALRRCRQIEAVHYDKISTPVIPIIADAEGGFGGIPNVFDLTLKLVEAGAAAIHLEDQLSSEKKCGHLGGKVLLPTSQFVNHLKAANLVKQAFQPDLVIIARTDAESATYITSNVDASDPVIESAPISKYYKYRNGLQRCVERGLAYAPYADVLWMETSNPSLVDAKYFAEAIHSQFPNKWLAYNCSPSFKWNKFFQTDRELSDFQLRLSNMGYKFQFITLAGFHVTNKAVFQLACDYKLRGMLAYAELQGSEEELEKEGYTGLRHQREAGVGYFDYIGGMVDKHSASALEGSTEEEQF